MASILVTGGKGFLGSHLVSRLLGSGESVRILARKPQKQKDKQEEENIILGDIRDPEAVERAVKGVDRVYHLVSNFRNAGSDEKEAYSVNVEGTINVLNACLKHKIERLIHCSTIGVHGSVREIPANENTPFNPGDLYQETKLIAEQKVWEFYKKSGLPTTVVRPISLYGPGDFRMLKLFRMIKKGRFVMVGEGDVFFQPAYIDDVIDGFVLCASHEKAVGEVFIIGGEGYLPLKKLIGIIAEKLQVVYPRFRLPLAPVEFLASACETVCGLFGIDPPLHKRRVSFFKNNRAFSIEKSRRLIGFSPKMSLSEGLDRTIKWYEENGYL